MAKELRGADDWRDRDVAIALVGPRRKPVVNGVVASRMLDAYISAEGGAVVTASVLACAEAAPSPTTRGPPPERSTDAIARLERRRVLARRRSSRRSTQTLLIARMANGKCWISPCDRQPPSRARRRNASSAAEARDTAHAIGSTGVCLPTRVSIWSCCPDDSPPRGHPWLAALHAATQPPGRHVRLSTLGFGPPVRFSWAYDAL